MFLLASKLKLKGHPNLEVVTYDPAKLPHKHRAFIEKTLDEDVLRLSGLTAFGDNPDDIRIWINPYAAKPVIKSTVLHELAHAFLGINVGHEHKWRSFYIRLLDHYGYFFEPPVDVCTYTMCQFIVSWYADVNCAQADKELNRILNQIEVEREQVKSKLGEVFATS